jgi:hypothetical protein
MKNNARTVTVAKRKIVVGSTALNDKTRRVAIQTPQIERHTQG